MADPLTLLDVLAAQEGEATITRPPAPGVHARTAWAEAARAVHGRYLAPHLHLLPCLPWELASCAYHVDMDPRAGRRVRHTARCTGTIMDVDVGPADWEAHGPSPTLYRPACLSCVWEGDPSTDENEALAEACDHAWPGWRDLPPYTGPRFHAMRPDMVRKHLAGYAATVAGLMPRWLEDRAPLPTIRQAIGTRSHWSYEADRYDLCAGVTPGETR